MGRPVNKEELREAANANFSRLLEMIENRTEEEKNKPYDFSQDEKKKEAHWKRDKNLRDVLVHLYEWHMLLLDWIKNREDGENRPFLMEGYNWKTYGEMNVVFQKRGLLLTEEQALDKLKESHARVMAAMETFSQEELFTNNVYPWAKGSAIGAYFISNTSSHYDWAMKKMKAHKKNVKN